MLSNQNIGSGDYGYFKPEDTAPFRGLDAVAGSPNGGNPPAPKGASLAFYNNKGTLDTESSQYPAL